MGVPGFRGASTIAPRETGCEHCTTDREDSPPLGIGAHGCGGWSCEETFSVCSDGEKLHRACHTQ